MDSQHGGAEEAGEQMGSELDAIQKRLRALKRKLDARESVVDLAGRQAADLAPSAREATD